MATFYLDPEGGNDANDGTSFANRWKTFTNGATAARIAPGDTIRVMKSRDVDTTSVNATWTTLSPTITLSGALNALITDCETAWTASANITATASTTRYRTGTKSCDLVAAAGFTTGKMAYFDLGSNQDYSAYQGITFWFRTSIAIAASALEIRLCSDATGDVAVDTFVIPANSHTGGVWYPVYIDKGSALGASIRSIAIHAASDPGTINLNIDNISTVKAVGSDNLNLTSVVGKNTADEGWWPLVEINGTTLKIYSGSWNDTIATAAKGYWGTTETVTFYKQDTTTYPLAASIFAAAAVINDSGTAGNPITFSGGWDRTNMSTQNGQTWLRMSQINIGIACSNRSYITFERIHIAHSYRGFDINTSSGSNITFSGQLYLAGLQEYGIWFGGSDSTFGNIYGTSIATAVVRTAIPASRMTFGDIIGAGLGFAGSSGHTLQISVNTEMFKAGTIKALNAAQDAIELTHGGYVSRLKITALEARNCGGYALDMATASSAHFALEIGSIVGHTSFSAAQMSGNCINGSRIKTITSTNNTNSAWIGGPGYACLIGSFTSSGNPVGISVNGVSQNFGVGEWRATSIAEATKRSFTANYVTILPQMFTTYLGTADAHRVEYGSDRGLITADTSDRHTASGYAWKAEVKHADFAREDFAMKHRVARVYCVANVAKYITIYVKRSNAAINCKLIVPGGQISGVDNDVATTASTTGAYELISCSFTPTQSGVVMVELWFWGGTTHHVMFDDLGVA